MYWIVATILVLFGIVSGFSIGQPFLLVGVALVALGPLRGRPRIFWPVLAATAAWDVGYWAVAPLGCVATSRLDGATSTVCSSLLGITYRGAVDYEPSLTPAILAGIAAAIAAAVSAEVIVLSRGTRARCGG